MPVKTTDISSNLSHLLGPEGGSFGFRYASSVPPEYQTVAVTLKKSSLSQQQLGQVRVSVSGLQQHHSTRCTNCIHPQLRALTVPHKHSMLHTAVVENCDQGRRQFPRWACIVSVSTRLPDSSGLFHNGPLAVALWPWRLSCTQVVAAAYLST